MDVVREPVHQNDGRIRTRVVLDVDPVLVPPHERFVVAHYSPLASCTRRTAYLSVVDLPSIDLMPARGNTAIRTWRALPSVLRSNSTLILVSPVLFSSTS